MNFSPILMIIYIINTKQNILYKLIKKIILIQILMKIISNFLLKKKYGKKNQIF